MSTRVDAVDIALANFLDTSCRASADSPEVGVETAKGYIGDLGVNTGRRDYCRATLGPTEHFRELRPLWLPLVCGRR